MNEVNIISAITIPSVIDCINIAERKIKETEAIQDKDLELIGKFKKILGEEINAKLK